ncbi:MAG TPA: hypothetical protein VKY44_07295 [Flavobacterium sp.]|nr:hypothetical protein [Flavobacterium sp.]
MKTEQTTAKEIRNRRTKRKLRRTLFVTFTTVTILFVSFMAFASLEEWWTVGVKGETSGYPWGPINDNPWYYNTPKLYSTVMLSEFIILIIGLALTTYFIVKPNKERAFYSLLVIWVLVIIILANGFVQ